MHSPTTPAQIAAQPPIRSDTDVIELVSSLVGPADRRQFWLMFLGPDDRPVPLIVPCAGFALDPATNELDDLGARACGIAAMVGAGSIVVTWERPGEPVLDDAERRAVHALAAAIAGRGVVVRGCFLSHSNGVVRVAEKSS